MWPRLLGQSGNTLLYEYMVLPMPYEVTNNVSYALICIYLKGTEH